MRLKIVSAAGLFALLAIGPVQGMEMRQKDADDFRDGLLSSFPDLANSDFLTVKPAGDRLQLTLDFNSFFDGLDPKSFRMTGFGPWSLFIRPQDSKTTNLNAETSVKASLMAKGVDGKAIEGNFSIGSLVLDGLIDLSTSGIQLGTSAKGVDFASKLGERQSAFRAGEMNSMLDWRASSAGSRYVDFDGSQSLSDYYQEALQSQVPEFRISAARIDHEYQLNKVPKREFNNLLLSLFAHGNGSFKNREEFENFRTALTASFPMLSFLKQSISAANLSVVSPLADVNAKYLNSTLILGGEAGAMQLAWGFATEDMKIDSEMIPASYLTLLPRSVDMQLRLEGLDFASAGRELTASRVQTTEDVRSMGERFSRSLLGNKSMVVNLKSLKLASDLYDLKLYGTVRTNGGKNSQLELWVIADDFDKSIAAVQELSKNEPDLGQLSLWMTVAKGFAQNGGRSSLWAVVQHPDGSVTVNNQPLVGPSETEN